MLRDLGEEERPEPALRGILADTGLSRRAFRRILALWGRDALDRIREDPYALVEVIDGVGFPTADRIALQAGFDPQGGARVRAGLLHILREAAVSDGHTCLPEETLLNGAARLLAVDPEWIQPELKGLERSGALVLRAGHAHLKDLFEDEALIARFLGILLGGSVVPGLPDYRGLAGDQREALAKAMGSGIFLLTGAPGTGKTFLIRRLVSSFPRARVVLAAPTGKAAKRIQEQTGRAASTLHRLLEPRKDEAGKYRFARNASNPLQADVIVLDEMSMVDTWLMARFLEAVALGTKLILVGDACQLPSVGPGNVLKDLIASGAVPCAELTLIKRQDEGLIIRNCHRIKQGEDIDPGPSPEFSFLSCPDEAGIGERILELVSKEIPRTHPGTDPVRDIQVITPLRERTRLSCAVLNEAFQRLLNPGPAVRDSRFKAGDKVIQTRNRYDLDILNGDIGRVLAVEPGAGSLVVRFENPERTVALSSRVNDLELAYAVTCHKFQGSEAPVVVIPIHASFGPWILQRNWLYTAVSRARKACILVGQRQEVPRILGRNRQHERHTRLAALLAGA